MTGIFVFIAVQFMQKRNIEEYTLNLSEKDTAVIWNVLLNPPAPNKALKDAAEHYKALLKKK
jgi:uncharacterized protein (DUF1778 family)